MVMKWWWLDRFEDMGSDGDCGDPIHRQRQVILTVVVLYGERVDDSGSLIVT